MMKSRKNVQNKEQPHKRKRLSVKSVRPMAFQTSQQNRRTFLLDEQKENK